jgi:molecular chaperone HscB
MPVRLVIAMDQTQKTVPKRTELQMARSMCWHCQSEMTGEYFCEQCVKVQPVSKDLDYFTCLGLPRRLNIDIGQLERKFYELSRAFHPDFYQNKTETEQQISLMNSALLNTAYRTLKDPFQRAEYLLRLEAGSAKDIRTSPPADLLEEILALQEDLEAIRTASPDGDRQALEPLRSKLHGERQTLEQRQAEMEQSLYTLFDEWDRLDSSSHDKARAGKDTVLKKMRDILSNRTYLQNIIIDLTTAIGEGR